MTLPTAMYCSVCDTNMVTKGDKSTGTTHFIWGHTITNNAYNSVVVAVCTECKGRLEAVTKI